LCRFAKGTSTVQGQASVEKVFNEYHPIGKKMLMITASRMTASVLAIHNNDILQHQAADRWVPAMIKHMMHPEAWFRNDRFFGVSQDLITTTTDTLSALSEANGGKRITVLLDDWTSNPDKR